MILTWISPLMVEAEYPFQFASNHLSCIDAWIGNNAFSSLCWNYFSLHWNELVLKIWIQLKLDLLFHSIHQRTSFVGFSSVYLHIFVMQPSEPFCWCWMYAMIKILICQEGQTAHCIYLTPCRFAYPARTYRVRLPILRWRLQLYCPNWSKGDDKNWNLGCVSVLATYI
jgi:hypothetical protein